MTLFASCNYHFIAAFPWLVCTFCQMLPVVSCEEKLDVALSLMFLQKSRQEVQELKAELEVMTMEGNPLNPKGNSLFAEVLC